MTADELAMACMEAVDADRGWLHLVIPGEAPGGNLVRLTPRPGLCPMGDLLNWQDNPPRCLATFDPLDILAWLSANNLIKLSIKKVLDNT